MTTRDKIGVVVIVVLFVVLILILTWTIRPHSDTVHAPEDSIFIQQRMINLQKSKERRGVGMGVPLRAKDRV